MFDLESELVECFQKVLNIYGPFSLNSHALEFNYSSGRTDILATNERNYLYSFEAKLLKWKEGLQQAYKNSSFSHFSYVLLPHDKISPALKNVNEFHERRIGLCTIKNSKINVLIKAPFNKPLQPWLTTSALDYILSNPNA